MRKVCIVLNLLVQLVFSSSFFCETALACSEFELIITEVMADPTPSFGLPEAEFIEIYNRSSNIILLSNYKLYEGSFRDLPAIHINPDEYVIICDDDDTAAFNTYGKVAWVSSMSLTNSGESVYLTCNSGVVVDSIKYSNTWFKNTYKEDGGWSVERVDRNFTCFNPSNWEPSSDLSGGTPGSINGNDGIFMDIVAPVPLNSFPTDSFHVVIEFTENVLLPVQLNQFYITGIGPPQTIKHFNGNKGQLIIKLPQSLLESIVYEMIIERIIDCSGNSSSIDTLLFGIADTTKQFRRITINEILYDPHTGCPEYMELKNSSGRTIDLSNYKTATLDIITGDVKNTYEIIESTYILVPEAIVVLCDSPELLDGFYNTPYPKRIIKPVEMGTLSNTEGRLAIMQGGEITDDIYYNESFHHKLLSQTKGVSLERISTSNQTSSMSNWHSTSSVEGYATPGYQNSHSVSGKSENDWLTITPDIFSPNNDGFDDLATLTIESANYGEIVVINIFDLNGNKIRSYDNILLSYGTNNITWNGTDDRGGLVSKGPYIIFAELFTTAGHIRSKKAFVVVSYN